MICAATAAAAGASRARARRRCRTSCCRASRWTSRSAAGAVSRLFRGAGGRGLARDRLRRRRASALAGARQPARRADRLRAVRGRRRQGAERDRAGAGSATSGCMPTTRARCCAGCPTPASPAPSSCFPIPGRRSAITSAGWSRRRRWPSSRASCAPAASCGSPPTSATMRAGCCWRCAGKPDFRWTRRRPGGLARAAADWPATRYEQKALREGAALLSISASSAFVECGSLLRQSLSLLACKPRKICLVFGRS